MPIYTSSKGEIKNTSEMPIEYLKRALAKAQANGDAENLQALEEEIMNRNNG